MSLLKDLFNVDRIKLAKENNRIKLSKKNLEEEFRKYKENTNDLKDKYIAILEEKTKGFDLYLHYEKECIRLADERKEIKKELALTKETLAARDEIISQQEKVISRLEKKISKPNETK